MALKLEKHQYATLFAFNEALDNPISAAPEDSNYPAINMLDSQPGRVYRGIGVVDHTISGHFTDGSGNPESRGVCAFALMNHNLTGTQKVRLDMGYDPTFTEVEFSTEWDGQDTVYGWGEGPWGDDPNVGGYETGAWGGRDRHLVKTFGKINVTYWRVIISKLSGIAEGYPEIGNLFLGDTFQSQTHNIQGLGSIPVIDPTELVETRAHSLRADPKSPYRTLLLDWHGLTEAEAFDFRDVCRIVGKRHTMIVSLAPETETEYSRLGTVTFLARMVEWDGPSRRGDTIQELYTANAQLREAL